ncbi:MAG: dihydropyrimidinase [Verrucomicrobiae bacterium]|nr:dihydropyrimidinase [Verrucomicrobiae bacterium]
MPLLIQNGEIITATDRYRADIYCEDQTITAIAPRIEPPPDATIIDARDKYIFPGFIDPHVHIYLPFMGTYAKDTYPTASRAALLGGTTTLIEMICPARNDDPLEAYQLWHSQAAGKSACDYTFHMGVTRFDESTPDALRQIVADGVASFKVFLAYKGALGINDTELYHTLRLARSLGVITTAHCENADLIAELQKQLLSEGKTAPEYHYHSRPPRVEAEGTRHLLTFAELTGAPVYIVHLSCAEALQEALGARQRGVACWIETLIQYLVLDHSYTQRPDFEGAKYVMSPPLRDRANHEVLWNALRQGFIHTVATDHAPFDFRGQKDLGRDNFTLIPNGIPSLEDRITVLYTYGVRRHHIDLHQFVAAASTQAAKIFGLYPRKGTIQLGSDADLVIFDPHYKTTISARTHHMNVDYNPFEGWPVEGRAETVTVRGRIMVRDGQFIGEMGYGQFLRRTPHYHC